MEKKIKPWQIVLFVVAIGAVGVGLWMSTRGDKIQLKSSVTMADLSTGEILELPVGKGGAMVPGLNPSTNKLTLLRVTKRDGKWFIIDRDLAALRAIEGGKEALVSAETGEIRVRN